MTAVREGPGEARLRAVLVCHPEHLVGVATAATLCRRGATETATAVTSLTRLLSSLHPAIDVALVFDRVEEELDELFEALRHRGLATPVLIAGSRVTPERAARILEMGAAGLLWSSCSADVLCQGVLDARSGAAVFPAEMRADVLQSLRARQLRRYAAQRRLAELSPAERRVLHSLADGRPVLQIAADMSLSPNTIRSHIHALGAKLEVHGQLRIAAAGRSLLVTARRTTWDSASPALGGEGA